MSTSGCITACDLAVQIGKWPPTVTHLVCQPLLASCTGPEVLVVWGAATAGAQGQGQHGVQRKGSYLNSDTVCQAPPPPRNPHRPGPLSSPSDVEYQPLRGAGGLLLRRRCGQVLLRPGSPYEAAPREDGPLSDPTLWLIQPDGGERNMGVRARQRIGQTRTANRSSLMPQLPCDRHLLTLHSHACCQSCAQESWS